ncbi:MAG: hypothetical protein IKP95_12860 [Ruminococcus sp.]|nr:hypothetical protein [Ruminococcus sp.]MBR6103311.1 hypothetical protein [Ruminococcus sp.]
MGDLQSGITIGEDGITGTLKYVSDYTGFSGDVSLQSGNFLVLHSTTNHDGATITVTVTNPVTLDDDGIVVLRVADKDTQTVTISASKEGYDTVTKVYSLSGLTCEAAPA